MGQNKSPSSFSQEDFDRKLVEILDKESGSTLLAIPGLYEVVSEYFNNEVLAELKEEWEEKWGAGEESEQ